VIKPRVVQPYLINKPGVRAEAWPLAPRLAVVLVDDRARKIATNAAKLRSAV